MLNAWHIVWDFLKVFWGSLEVKLPTIFMDTFRLYGQMEQQRWEESEKGRAEERRSGRLGKAAGAQPSGQMVD